MSFGDFLLISEGGTLVLRAVSDPEPLYRGQGLVGRPVSVVLTSELRRETVKDLLPK